MSSSGSAGPDFEERLLEQLKAVVAERGAAEARRAPEREPAAAPAWRRRGPRLALGAGIAVAVLAVAVLIFSAGGGQTPKAFAIQPQAGGGKTVRIFSLREAAALEQALERNGIKAQVNWLPTGMTCREPHFTPTQVHLPGGGSFGGMTVEGPLAPGLTFQIGSTKLWRKRATNRHWQKRHKGVPLGDFNLDPAAFGPDQAVVISASPLPYLGNPEGAFEASFGVAEGRIGPCEPVPGPKDHEALRLDEEQARHDPRFREATT